MGNGKIHSIPIKDPIVIECTDRSVTIKVNATHLLVFTRDKVNKPFALMVFPRKGKNLATYTTVMLDDCVLSF